MSISGRLHKQSSSAHALVLPSRTYTGLAILHPLFKILAFATWISVVISMLMNTVDIHVAEAKILNNGWMNAGYALGN